MRRLPSSLHIVSWNVAGWSTTAANIAKFHGSLGNWLDRHSVDILCLQEVKATREKLTGLVGWDTFLSACVSRPGLNGVATLVRKHWRGSGANSFPTVGADARPFIDSDLDGQGRCILTDHGVFTLINVYVPYDGEKGVQLDLKLRFLESLLALILKVQQSGRAVVCVGDFNVARHPRDIYFEFRKIDLDAMLADGGEAARGLAEGKVGYPLSMEVVGIVEFLVKHWAALRAVLLDREVVEIVSKPPVKYVLKVGVSSGKGLIVGQRHATPGRCEATANPASITTAEGCLYKRAGVLSVGDLFESISRIVKVDFSLQAKMAFADLFGLPRSPPPVVQLFERIFSACKLIDTYIAVNPAGRTIASERFTCWDQYRNERYENKGARIDYVLVDHAVAPAVRLVEGPRDSKMHDSETPDSESHDSESHDSKSQDSEDDCFNEFLTQQDRETGTLPPESPRLPSLSVSTDRGRSMQAATAEGRWKAVPFTGGGIDSEQISAEAKNFEFRFTNPPHTGIVYTAPLFSDHVATSVVLDLGSLSAAGILDRMQDPLGVRWKAGLAAALISKPQSLKDMFAARKVIEIDATPPTTGSSRKRTFSNRN